jgi:hypothetical protein
MQEHKGPTAPAPDKDPSSGSAVGSGGGKKPEMGTFMQGVAAKWRKLPEAERQVYYDIAAEERKSYARSKKLLVRGLKIASEGETGAE